MGFERARSARDAKWVEEALQQGEWTKVSSVVRPDERCPGLRDVLQPVVGKPPDLSLPPAFESRKMPPGWEAEYEAERDLDFQRMKEWLKREMGIKVAGRKFAVGIHKRKGKN